MKDNNLILTRSFDFALDIIDLYKHLVGSKEFVLSKQLLKSGTSIGANVKESVNAISKADFRNKMSIALKEADETEYWLELIQKAEFLSDYDFEDIIKKCKSICRILNKIVQNSST